GVTGPQRGGSSTFLQTFSGGGGVSGYLGLLQQAQVIRNTQDNLRLQIRTLDRLEALYNNDLIDIVQVDQFRQNIEVTRSTLLDQQTNLELSLDNYKVLTLGLPPDLPIDLDEELVDRFQLISSESTQVLDEILQLQIRTGDVGELSDLASKLQLLDLRLKNLMQYDSDQTEETLRQLYNVLRTLVRRSSDLDEQLNGIESSELVDALSEDETQSLRILRERFEADGANFLLQVRDAADTVEQLLKLKEAEEKERGQSDSDDGVLPEIRLDDDTPGDSDSPDDGESSRASSSDRATEDALADGKSETTGDDADQVGDAASDDSAATDSQFVDAVRQRRGWLREWHTLSRGMLVAGALRRQTSADPKTLLEDARSFVKPVEDLFNDASSNLDDMEKMGRDPS
ncbi:MAG: hypothetical protein AAFN70_17570, partial [Planctomycetota bacterium]